MKHAWQSVASVARSTIPWSIGPSSIDEATRLITRYRGRFSSRSPRASEVAVSDASRHMCEAHILALGIRCPRPLPAHGCGGYTSYRAITTEHRGDGAPQVSDEDDVRRVIRDRHIEFMFAQFVDMHGKPSAKLVPAHHIDDLLSEGAGFAGFAAGDIGQGPHDPDMIAVPDPKTLTILPWQPNVARFACDVTVEGEPWP